MKHMKTLKERAIAKQSFNFMFFMCFMVDFVFLLPDFHQSSGKYKMEL